MAGEHGSSLHEVVFPWPAFGHMLPYLELSKSLARRGHRISFISTPRNIQRLPKPSPRISHLITFVPFDLPRVDGLPETAEATSDLPPQVVPYLKKAFDGLEHPFREFIKEATPKPDWIIQDFAQHWIPQIAAEANIPTIHLSIFIAGSLVFLGSRELNEEAPRTTAEQFAVPPPWIPIPSKLCLRLHEARRVFQEYVSSNISGLSDTLRCSTTLGGCTALAIRSCFGVEAEWLELLPQIFKKPVFPIGLLPPPAPEGTSDDNEASANIMGWLSQQKSRSLVYIAFGSEATLSIELLHELALGLQLATLPFLWALRRPHNLSNDEELLPEGFEERIKDYGLVAEGWVPQLKILAHGSIGGFLTHSGWSSVIESFQFGHPLLLLPIFGDQGINARVIMEKGIAVGIDRNEEDGSFTKEAVAATLRLVMVEEEGESLRSKAKELKDVFTDRDRQEKYVDDFVQYLQNRGSKSKQGLESVVNSFSMLL